MTAVAEVPVFRSPGEALGLLESAARFLAGAEYAGLPSAVTGAVLLGLERADAAGTVARGRALAAFDAADGHEDDVPWWIRRAVHTRDQGCRWPGGCGQPAAATQPHHIRHRSEHGSTKVENLYNFCFWHHHVMVHRRGWTVRVRGDGTLEARSPDGRVYTDHTRPPPPPRVTPRPGNPPPRVTPRPGNPPARRTSTPDDRLAKNGPQTRGRAVIRCCAHPRTGPGNP